MSKGTQQIPVAEGEKEQRNLLKWAGGCKETPEIILC